MTSHLSEDQIRRYHNCTLPPQELIVVDQHLSDCGDCRNKAAQILPVASILQPVWNEFAEIASAQPEHVTYEQLEQFVDDKLQGSERDIVESHLEICAECATVDRDLRQIKNELTSGSKIIWWQPATKIAAAAAAIMIIALGIAVWKLQTQSQSAAMQIRDLRNQLATAKQIDTTKSNLPPDQEKLVASVLTSRQLSIPSFVSDLIGQKGQLMGSSTDQSFSLHSPVGTVVETTQPTFAWAELEGTNSYEVAVFDTDFRAVEKSGTIKTSNWKPSKPLQRGKSYAWQVIAERNGEFVKSPIPPHPPAIFHVLEENKLKQFQEMQKSTTSHLILGILSANLGLLDSAEAEFHLASSGKSQKTAEDFLQQLNTLRNK
ncbi:MAG TPA: zf-HC2 domain-containing protein [Acidobacteriota bacterium]|nr:zf-HC2 domain-containing protein [Acidobacteriota bacterium]